MSVRPDELPENALLARHRDDGAYTDCYSTTIPLEVDFATYVEAFYSSWAFRPERWFLRLALKRPASDFDITRLTRGGATRFAAWDIEARSPDQLLLCDLYGRTRSWLHCSSGDTGRQVVTTLYFGSAVVPKADRRSGERSMGGTFSALLGFHRLYSRTLLAAASARLLAPGR